MRFGLDRMRRMMTALGSPERRFDTIHVLGTNGKSSTTRMIAAILQGHGSAHRRLPLAAPGLLPRAHPGRRARARHRGLRGAVARAAWAAEQVNRTLAEDDHVTQFELLTAAALWEMARREVEVAVLEAGLGGRYDATSVIDARVTVLTNVGLEHTRWLGPTIADIAEEKLAVVSPGTTLVLGRGARGAGAGGGRAGGGRAPARGSCARGRCPPVAELLARGGPSSARNFALARAAAEAYLRGAAIAPRERAVAEAAATVRGAGTPAAGRAGSRRRCSTAPTTPTRSRARWSRCRTWSRRGAARTRAGRARGQGRGRDARRRCCPASSAHGSRRRRAAARCRRRRCSRSRASSASRRPRASPARRARSRRRGRWAVGRGGACSQPARSTSWAICSARSSGVGGDCGPTHGWDSAR